MESGDVDLPPPDTFSSVSSDDDDDQSQNTSLDKSKDSFENLDTSDVEETARREQKEKMEKLKDKGGKKKQKNKMEKIETVVETVFDKFLDYQKQQEQYILKIEERRKKHEEEMEERRRKEDREHELKLFSILMGSQENKNYPRPSSSATFVPSHAAEVDRGTYYQPNDSYESLSSGTTGMQRPMNPPVGRPESASSSQDNIQPFGIPMLELLNKDDSEPWTLHNI